MKVRFQYADWSEWEGPPEGAHESPDKGVVRMFAVDDFGGEVVFVYDDFYYFYPVDGGWCFGSGTPKRAFILRPAVHGSETEELPFTLPRDAIVRNGQTVSQEDAVRFGLISTVDQKELHAKRSVPIEFKE